MVWATVAAWVGTAVAATSAYVAYDGARDASRSSEEQAREEARLEGILTDEKVRQLEVEHKEVLGQQRAGYAASNVDVGPGGKEMGSVMDVLEETSFNFLREIQVTKETGASRASNALIHGRNVAKQYQNQANQQILNSAASIFSIWANR